MPTWLLYTVFSVIFVLASTAIFFFTLTRGALIIRGTFGGSQDDAAHIYPIYSNMRLIKLIDFQPLIAAILLFQYDRAQPLVLPRSPRHRAGEHSAEPQRGDVIFFDRNGHVVLFLGPDAGGEDELPRP